MSGPQTEGGPVKWWGWGFESKTYLLDDKPQFWPYLLTTRYRIDDGPEQEQILNTFVVANGRFYAAGLKPAPNAQLDDGLFDIVSIGDVGFLEAASSLGKFRKGTHLEIPKVSLWRGRTVIATSDETQLVEMEGEVVGRLPARFEMLPKAMNIIV